MKNKKESKNVTFVFNCFLIVYLVLNYKCHAEIALPNYNLIGLNYSDIGNVLLIKPSSTLPQFVKLELQSGRLSAMVLEYSEADETFISIKSQLQTSIEVLPRIDSEVTTVWRLEEKECSIMLTWNKEEKRIQIIIRKFSAIKSK